jgi:DNA-directed RNA polymerase subunit F
LANAAKLSTAGFSQTFIEQVVAAGTTTGNELASAILQSTPETQKELQSLFGSIETTANSGMDQLAQEIYNKQGLATQELKDLYAQTQTDLTTALAEQQTAFTKATTEAAKTFIEEVKEIKVQLKEDLAEIGTDFSLLDGQIATLNTTMDTLISNWDKLGKLDPVTIPDIKFPSGPRGDGGVIRRDTGNTGTQNIYLTVKNDTTKSTDQVGKDVAKVINRYTTRGGGLKIGRASV